eukprot:TRINITY_DN2249_c0_g3_i2.p1 TRINITY_DN2249_c0_g3~~TRINITY_DN2249_c0_g3_i2.p1  ORF type:complete len:450 (-),score=77.10 TRINITY_DN2249_c0_g3_i2:284-1633(-)
MRSFQRRLGTLLSICLCLFVIFDRARGLKTKDHNHTRTETLVDRKSPEFSVQKPSLPPRNISNIYEGSWVFAVKNSSMPFTQTSGELLLQFHHRKSSVADVDVLIGIVSIRDGIYSTDPSSRYFLYGIYTKSDGTLKTYGLPMGAKMTAAHEGLHDLPRNASIAMIESHSIARAEYEKYLEDHPESLPESSCDFWLSMYSKTIHHDNEGGSGKDYVRLTGVLESTTCSSALLITAEPVEFDVFYSKAINYALISSIFMVAEVLLLIQQIDFSSTPSGAAKVSLLSIGQQAIIDSYLCLIHLTTGIIIEPLFNAFSTAAFLKFVMFSVYEMRYLLFIWKARRPQIFSEGLDAWRQELGFLYIRFYGFLMLGIFLFYRMQGMFSLFVILMYSFWIPQIVSNIQRDCRKPLLPKYIIGISISRMFLPFYFYGCPHNILETQPNTPILIGLCL